MGTQTKIKTIGSEVELQKKFGNPDSTNFEYWFTAANFLAYGNNLKLVRAINKDARNWSKIMLPQMWVVF